MHIITNTMNRFCRAAIIFLMCILVTGCKGKNDPEVDKEKKEAQQKYDAAVTLLESGLSADYSQALELLEQSAQQGSDSAQVVVGALFEYGLGTDADMSKAKDYYSEAAEQGNQEAKEKLRILEISQSKLVIPSGFSTPLNEIMVWNGDTLRVINGDASFFSSEKSVTVVDKDLRPVYVSFRALEGETATEPVSLDAHETAVSLLLLSIPYALTMENDHYQTLLREMLAGYPETDALAKAIETTVGKNGYLLYDEFKQEMDAAVQRINTELGMNRINKELTGMKRSASARRAATMPFSESSTPVSQATSGVSTKALNRPEIAWGESYFFGELKTKLDSEYKDGSRGREWKVTVANEMPMYFYLEYGTIAEMGKTGDDLKEYRKTQGLPTDFNPSLMLKAVNLSKYFDMVGVNGINKLVEAYGTIVSDAGTIIEAWINGGRADYFDKSFGKQMVSLWMPIETDWDVLFISSMDRRPELFLAGLFDVVVFPTVAQYLSQFGDGLYDPLIASFLVNTDTAEVVEMAQALKEWRLETFTRLFTNCINKWADTTLRECLADFLNQGLIRVMAYEALTAAGCIFPEMMTEAMTEAIVGQLKALFTIAKWGEIVANSAIWALYQLTIDSYSVGFSIQADGIPAALNAVDMGLSVKWANCNLGASSQWGDGRLFSWGETRGEKSSYEWDTYAWGKGWDSITKYNGQDGLTILESDDDAVTKEWGGKWRMPTAEEFQELVDNCKFEVRDLWGQRGFMVTSKKTGEYIYLPSAGASDLSATLEGRYWTSSLFEGDPSKARDFDFTTYATTGSYSIGEALRRRGLSVRGVQEIGQPKLKVSETFLEFENTKVGQSSQLDWTITNVGNATLTVSSLTVPSGFSTDYSNWSPKNLAAGESHTFKIYFNPTEAKTYSGKLVLKSNAVNTPEASFTIGGIGTLATVSVTSVSLNISSLDLTVGSTSTLTAIVLPDNADNKSVNWTSSKSSVATVSASGMITAVAPGTASITVTTIDGGQTATCVVTVVKRGLSDNEYGWEDLGLPSGLKWATCNVGASTPEEYGDYFAWGEIEPYYVSQDPLVWKDGKGEGYDWLSYRWCMGDEYSIVKYINQIEYLTPTGVAIRVVYGLDNKTTLELRDDAASRNWWGDWRMPTMAEFTELCDNCTITWTTRKGVSGSLFTSKNNGKSVFFPAAGERYGTYLSGSGEYGWKIGVYWSSSLCPNNLYRAGLLVVEEDESYTTYRDRCAGLSVRPVIDAGVRVTVRGVSVDKTSVTLNVNETTTVSATITPANSDNKRVTWTSSKPSVATVSSSGVVTAVAEGSAVITVTTSDGGYTASCNVTVKNSAPDPEPKLSVSTKRLDFGNQIKFTQETKNITITNSGTGTLQITSISKTNNYGDLFQLSGWTSGGSIAAGASKTVTVSFQPLEERTYEETLTIVSSNAVGDKKVTVTLVGTGAPEPENALIQINGDNLSWGDVELGESVTKSFSVKNTGTTTLNISSVKVVATDNTVNPSYFAISPNSSCTVSPGKTMTFNVTFSPESVRNYSAVVSIKSNAGNASQGTSTVTLSGSGIEATSRVLSASPSSLSFGSQTVGNRTHRNFTIYNRGTKAVTLYSMVASDGFYLGDAWSPGSNLSMAAGSSKTFSIAFAPTQLRSYTGNITITSNAAGGDLVIPLSGMGVEAQGYLEIVSGDNLDFGNVSIGTSGSLYTKIKNTGDAPLKILGFTCTEGFSAQCNNSPLEEGAIGSIAVSFSPTQAKYYSGYVTVNTDAENENVTIYVQGTGKQSSNSTTFVDMGVSVKWASTNVGAAMPEDFGHYVAWGETAIKTQYLYDNYKFYVGPRSSGRFITKYCPNSDYGYQGYHDNLSRLELEDDHANIKLGGRARIPTRNEWSELKKNSTWQWTSQGGVNGYLVTSTINGNTIFLPAGGKIESRNDDVNTAGYYWTSDLNRENNYAHTWELRENKVGSDYRDRCIGLLIRAVEENDNSVSGNIEGTEEDEW